MVPPRGFRRKRGRSEARGVRFLSRYPVLALVPLSVLSLGIGYAYAAGLAGSWSYIHGAKATAVFTGAALGVGLVIGTVVGARGAGALLIVPAVVVVVGIVVTRQEIAPAVGPAGKITTGFEAALFALLSVVWCVSSFAFLGLLPRMWRARMAFSRPERALHITRAPHWSEASAAPIPLVEWRQFAESRDDLAAFDPRAEDQGLAFLSGSAKDGKAARKLAVRERQLRASQDLIMTRPDLIARNPDLARALPPGIWTATFAYERGDGSRMYLTWFNGEIVIAGIGRDRASDVASMQPIAWSLGAHLVDDDGKVYEHASAMVAGRRVLPVGESARYGMVRGVVPLSIGLVFVAIGVLVGSFAKWVPHHPTPGAVTAVALIAMGLVALACHFSIVWFNHPTWLIPPHMRGDGQARSRRRSS